MNRRNFVQSAGASLILCCGLGCNGKNTSDSDQPDPDPLPTETYLMPDESDFHSATWMAFGATADAWGTSGNYGQSRAVARKDLMRIAANLSRFEPVKMLVSHAEDLAEAQLYLEQVKNEPVNPSASFIAGQTYTGGAELPAIEAAGAIEFIMQAVDDLWIRDTGPVFVWGANQQLAGVNFNFNGWGQEDSGAAGWQKDPDKAANGVVDQPIANDRRVADFVIAQAGASRVSTDLVLEGGGIEVNGLGTAICTESCILNSNRNPGVSKSALEQELARLLGVKKIIWLPGLKAQEITDGHIDFYARFAGPTTVVYGLDPDPWSYDYAVTLQNQQLLSSATNAEGEPISALALTAPDFETVKNAVNARNWGDADHFNEESFAAGYVGFYLANHCVLLPQFGDDAADQAAFITLQALYPERIVIQITIDGIANGGGSIHCATQQQISQP